MPRHGASPTRDTRAPVRDGLASDLEPLRRPEASYEQLQADWSRRRVRGEDAWRASTWRTIQGSGGRLGTLVLTEFVEPDRVEARRAEGWQVIEPIDRPVIHMTLPDDPGIESGGITYLGPRVVMRLQLGAGEVDDRRDTILEHLVRRAADECQPPSAAVLGAVAGGIGRSRARGGGDGR